MTKDPITNAWYVDDDGDLIYRDDIAGITSVVLSKHFAVRRRRAWDALVSAATGDRLLTLTETAERLGTGMRFVRRLVAERRIDYVKLGTHVRIPLSAIRHYVANNTVPRRNR